MNNRESSSKASKKQFRGVVEQRLTAAKKKAEPEPLSAEELAAAEAKAAAKAAQKAAGFAEFQRKKAERKRLRSKHHPTSEYELTGEKIDKHEPISFFIPWIPFVALESQIFPTMISTLPISLSRRQGGDLDI